MDSQYLTGHFSYCKFAINSKTILKFKYNKIGLGLCLINYRQLSSSSYDLEIYKIELINKLVFHHYIWSSREYILVLVKCNTL